MMEISVELDIIGSVYGVSGQLVALPGEIIELPILCQNCPVMLEWKYSSNYQVCIFVSNCQFSFVL